MTPYNHAEQIDQALAQHLSTLHDALFDVLAALLTFLLFITSLTHALVRIVYALVGIIIWTFALWIVGLQTLQKKVVARSQTSPFRELHDE